MASLKCASRGIGVFFIISGVGIFLIAIAILTAFPFIYKQQLHRSLALTEGSLLFNLWKDVPIPIYQKFYFFNISNANDFKRGAKLEVVEVGPYVYQCSFVKENMTWYPNKTLSFREKRTYVFDRDLSNGSEDDFIYTLNGPLVMAADYIKNYPDFERAGIGFLFGIFGETLVTRKKVKELTYLGYPDKIIKYGKYLRPELPYKDKFAWMYGKNDTDDGLFNVFTGEDDLSKLNIINDWNGSRKLKFWKNDTCNMINGTNGEVSPPLEKNQQELTFFQSLICRSMTFNYTGEVSHLRLDGKRFEITEDVLANETINPDNACYDTKPYLPSGALDLGACQYGAPVVLSLPHFYLADPLYLKSVDGLYPNESLHTSYIDAMSLVGFGMEMVIRLQINAYVHNDPTMLQLSRVSNGVYPIFWMEISGKITQWLADYIHGKVNDPKTIAYSVVGVLLGLGLILITVGIVFIFVSPRSNKQGKKCEDDPLLEGKANVAVYSSLSTSGDGCGDKGTPQYMNTNACVRQDLHQSVEGSQVPTESSINQHDTDVSLLDS